MLGAAIFVGYHIVAPAASDRAEIVVTVDRIASLAAQFSGMHGGRPPREAELRGVIDTYVRDEMLYREGLALGLDRNDPVVRNRVRQKAGMLSDDAMAAEPTDADLEAYLKAHRDEFDIPAQVSFEQVYFDPRKHQQDIARALVDARTALDHGARAESLGDPTLLPATMSRVLPRDIAAVFGESFGTELRKLDGSRWEGPVRSAFGVHLVRISWRGAPTRATLAEARDVLAREWHREHAVQARERLYRELARRYPVRIEPYTGVVPIAAN